MREISGMGNWNIKYKIQEEGIRILRAVTCDQEAYLPEHIQGMPVVELSDYALNGRGREPEEEGEEIRIRNYRGEEGEWNNRNMISLHLPSGIRTMGSYVFMGLFYLEEMELADTVLSWGLSPWMGCRNLHRIIFHRDPVGNGNLAHLCAEVNRELDVILMEEGKQVGEVLFPEYTELVEENTPARQFNQRMEGIGYPYHYVFRNRKLPWREYDLIWESAISRGGDTAEALLKLAWYRIRWPEGLGQEFRKAYQVYLQARKEELLDLVMEHGSPSDLRLLLKEIPYERDSLERGSELARAAGNTQCQALILEKLHGERPTGRRKRFDL